MTTSDGPLTYELSLELGELQSGRRCANCGEELASMAQLTLGGGEEMVDYCPSDWCHGASRN